MGLALVADRGSQVVFHWKSCVSSETLLRPVAAWICHRELHPAFAGQPYPRTQNVKPSDQKEQGPTGLPDPYHKSGFGADQGRSLKSYDIG